MLEKFFYNILEKKKPVINFERNQLKNQKPQILIGLKISLKMHENSE